MLIEDRSSRSRRPSSRQAQVQGRQTALGRCIRVGSRIEKGGNYSGIGLARRHHVQGRLAVLVPCVRVGNGVMVALRATSREQVDRNPSVPEHTYSADDRM